MNSPSTAPIVAAAVAASRRRVLRRFRDAGAISEETAIAFEPKRPLERRYFNSLVDYGAVVETEPGHYFLDEEMAAEHRAKRRKRALTIVGAVLVLGAAAFGISRL